MSSFTASCLQSNEAAYLFLTKEFSAVYYIQLQMKTLIFKSRAFEKFTCTNMEIVNMEMY